MARLSKENMRARGSFKFTQEEVQLPEIPDDKGEPGSVLVRAPSVKQRDDIAKNTPDNPEDWTIGHTALIFSTVVVDPQLSKEEAAEFLGDWPGEALDKVIGKFNELIGATREELKRAAGEFRSSD